MIAPATMDYTFGSLQFANDICMLETGPTELQWTVYKLVRVKTVSAAKQDHV